MSKLGCGALVAYLWRAFDSCKGQSIIFQLKITVITIYHKDQFLGQLILPVVEVSSPKCDMSFRLSIIKILYCVISQLQFFSSFSHKRLSQLPVACDCPLINLVCWVEVLQPMATLYVSRFLHLPHVLKPLFLFFNVLLIVALAKSPPLPAGMIEK